MKTLISILFLIILCILVYLGFMYHSINTIQEKNIETFLTGQTGISKICNLATDPKNYNNPAVCFDISYNDTTTGLPVQVRAEIQPGYYIDSSGYLNVVPYGNISSSDKFSYVPQTRTALYEKASISNTNSEINAEIAKLEQQLAATPTSNKFVLNGIQQKITNLKEKKLSTLDSSSTSNSNYNSDNYDMTYHADPTKQTQQDSSTAGVGKMWIDISGSLVAVPYSDISNTTLYHSSGSYTFNPPAYVPNYEESVFLSKLTNEPTTSYTHNLATNQNGFCASTQTSTIERDKNCNSLDKNVCASTDCCILLGGEKCIAGNQNGPTNKTHYSDITIQNRDYYYYKGDCFGNCSS